MAEKKPAGVDLVIAMGGPKKPPVGKDAKKDPDYASEGSEVPGDFEAAYKDYMDDPSASTMYELIKTCHSEE